MSDSNYARADELLSTVYHTALSVTDLIALAQVHATLAVREAIEAQTEVIDAVGGDAR